MDIKKSRMLIKGRTLKGFGTNCTIRALETGIVIEVPDKLEKHYFTWASLREACSCNKCSGGAKPRVITI